jgi:nucleotide-binding universal stress UspA family protein
MKLEHIVVASDETDAGRSAARTGLDLAARSGARLTFMTVVPAEPALVTTAGARLSQWVHTEVATAAPTASPAIGIAVGVPGIEICRFAEDQGADLLVLGRKPRTRAARLLLGDTADAVARRSLVPSLYVHPGATPIRRIVVALDGTERGMIVFRHACLFASVIGARLGIVTVEPAYSNEPESLAASLPTARSQALIDRVTALAASDRLDCLDRGRWNGSGGSLVTIRRGDVVHAVLDEVEAADADCLAVGYRRGGPPGSVEGGSVARQIAHRAPCAFLAVPL